MIHVILEQPATRRVELSNLLGGIKVLDQGLGELEWGRPSIRRTLTDLHTHTHKTKNNTFVQKSDWVVSSTELTIHGTERYHSFQPTSPLRKRRRRNEEEENTETAQAGGRTYSPPLLFSTHFDPTQNRQRAQQNGVFLMERSDTPIGWSREERLLKFDACLFRADGGDIGPGRAQSGQMRR